METTRPPGFPGNPPVRMPRAPTPARSPPPRPLRCGEIAFRPTHDVGPHKQCISGLNHAAYGLPVNASRPGSPQAHASLGSGWRPTLAGWDWIPTGFRTRFQRSYHGILSPLTGLSRHTRWCKTRPRREATQPGRGSGIPAGVRGGQLIRLFDPDVNPLRPFGLFPRSQALLRTPLGPFHAPIGPASGIISGPAPDFNPGGVNVQVCGGMRLGGQKIHDRSARKARWADAGCGAFKSAAVVPCLRGGSSTCAGHSLGSTGSSRGLGLSHGHPPGAT